MLRVPVAPARPDAPAARPTRGTSDAGADLYARDSGRSAPPAAAGHWCRPAGRGHTSPGYAGFVQPRSGLALRHGVTCLNTPGLIDAGYRGELSVLLVNTDPEYDYEVARGDRIAQLVIQTVEHAVFEPVDADLRSPAADRGAGGFGHSGR